MLILAVDERQERAFLFELLRPEGGEGLLDQQFLPAVTGMHDERKNILAFFDRFDIFIPLRDFRQQQFRILIQPDPLPVL